MRRTPRALSETATFAGLVTRLCLAAPWTAFPTSAHCRTPRSKRGSITVPVGGSSPRPAWRAAEVVRRRVGGREDDAVPARAEALLDRDPVGPDEILRVEPGHPTTSSRVAAGRRYPPPPASSPLLRRAGRAP